MGSKGEALVPVKWRKVFPTGHAVNNAAISRMTGIDNKPDIKTFLRLLDQQTSCHLAIDRLTARKMKLFKRDSDKSLQVAKLGAKEARLGLQAAKLRQREVKAELAGHKLAIQKLNVKP